MTEKEACYPDNITISEFNMEVKLQSLLDHTTHRLLELQSEAIDIAKTSHKINPLSLVLISKYGF